MGLREHEAEAGLRQAAAEAVRIEPQLDTEGGEHVGGAGAGCRGPIAMLGDRHAAGGGDDRGERRDVVAAGMVASGADDVDGALGRLDP